MKKIIYATIMVLLAANAMAHPCSTGPTGAAITIGSTLNMTNVVIVAGIVTIIGLILLTVYK